MSMRNRIVSLAVAAGAAAAIFGTAAPANATAIIGARKCPSGYTGVEVYDGNGNYILWACINT